MFFYCIVAWNVNGYSDKIHSCVRELLKSVDILFLSETKRRADVLTSYFSEFVDFDAIINPHDPATYHGVVFLIRKTVKFEVLESNMTCGVRQDSKSTNPSAGRIISVLLDNDSIVVGTYVPNSGTTAATKARNYGYRVSAWDPALQDLLNTFRLQNPVVWLGDINVAQHEVDVSNPRTMSLWSGFTPDERDNLTSFLNSGWVDIWRHGHPGEAKYTWIGSKYRPNYGMRLDNIIVSDTLVPRVNSTFMMDGILLSDHIPIGAYIQRSAESATNLV